MKDLGIVKEFKELTVTDGYGVRWNPKHSYKFTNPEGTIYSKILGFIKNEGYASKHEIWKSVILPEIIKTRKIHPNWYMPSEDGYYNLFWQNALKQNIIKKYRHGRHIYYMITEKGKMVIEGGNNERSIKPASIVKQKIHVNQYDHIIENKNIKRKNSIEEAMKRLEEIMIELDSFQTEIAEVYNQLKNAE